MISKNQIKHIRSLRLKKFRQKYDKFIVEGYKTSLEFIKSQKYPIDSVYVTDKLDKSMFSPRLSEKINIQVISEREMEQISIFKNPSSILLVCQIPASNTFALHKMKKVIFLDNLQDPGNLGTILRVADWFGINAVIASTDTVDFFNAKTISASMGSLCGVEIGRMDYDTLQQHFPHHKVIGTTLDGQEARYFEYPDRAIVIIGNEGQGISKEVENRLDYKVTIEGHEGRIAESLNAGIATAIICTEWAKA